MSEIASDLDRAATNYWQSVAGKAGPNKGAALDQAAELLRKAQAEARPPDTIKSAPEVKDVPSKRPVRSVR